MLSSLSTVALLALMSAPPADEAGLSRSLHMEDIATGYVGDFYPVDGELDAFLMLKDGSILLISNLDLIDLSGGKVNLRGHRLEQRSASNGEDPPDVFRTAWVGKDRKTHEVITDCRKYSTLLRCAKAHQEAVEALESVFPQVDAVVRFNEVNPYFQEVGDEVMRSPTSGVGGVTILPGIVIRT